MLSILGLDLTVVWCMYFDTMADVGDCPEQHFVGFIVRIFSLQQFQILMHCSVLRSRLSPSIDIP